MHVFLNFILTLWDRIVRVSKENLNKVFTNTTKTYKNGFKSPGKCHSSFHSVRYCSFCIEHGKKLERTSDNSIKEKFEIFKQAPKMCDFMPVESLWSIIKADVAKKLFLI